MSKTFCPIPWIFQAARPNGDIRVCCQANVTKNKGVIRKVDGSAYNAGRDNLSESRNAVMMQQMRTNMLTGVWSEECGRCQQEEKSGLVSRRSYELEQWNYSFEQALTETNNAGLIDVEQTPVRYYDFRFGNFCNLKCRMCGPTDSSAWYEDWISLTGKNTFNDTSGEVTINFIKNKLQTSEYDWPSYEPFWQALEKNAKNIEHVYFAGGEPMLIERHYDFLERCVEQQVSQNIVLEYNTNCSTLPTRVLRLWQQFKQVRVGASIDGMGSVFEYQRHPAKWEKTLKNLKTLDALPTNITGWLAFTVTAYNINHMIDFMKWKLVSSNFKKINSTNRRPIVTYHVAHHPKHLNIRVLPTEYKQFLTLQFNNFVVWVTENNFNKDVARQASEIANGITTYMNCESYHSEYWNEFVEYTHGLDKLRGESIFDIEPKFREYIHEL